MSLKPPIPEVPVLAFDKSSVRSIDKFGRMHVERSHISKAGVNPYYGKEIPLWTDLGLDPDKVYAVFRPPEELAKAVETANRVPILAVHKKVSADDPKKELIIGTTGSSAQFDGEYLDNDLAFWDGEYIPKIENDEQRELSSAYSYIPVLSKGAYNGTPYDMVMTVIEFNHVCLVVEGRVGSDVLVADSQIPHLAKVKPVKVKLNPKQLEALKKRAAALVALDEGLDTGAAEAALQEALEEVQELAETTVVDPAATTTSDAEGGGNAEVCALLKQVIEKLGGAGETTANDEVATTATAAKKTPAAENVGAMDEKTVQKLVDAGRAATEKLLQAKFEAVTKVKPVTGDLDPMAFDSAEAIYGHALKVAGQDPTKHDQAAYKGIFEVVLEQRKTPAAPIAQDAKTVTDLTARFAGLKSIRQA